MSKNGRHEVKENGNSEMNKNTHDYIYVHIL